MYRILVPVDTDPDRARGQAAFVEELPTSAENIEVIVTHALPPDDVKDPDDADGIEQVETVQLARDYLEDRGYAVTLAEGRLPPADGILDIAEEHEADHIVMGSRKRSPTGKVIFGSVSQQVLLESPVPVTVVGTKSA
ncbi:universal stress protein [Haloarcula sp. S1CR25-12]|uniref:Universal stress protein n=1 Tax=Haloarcula saliterrae TaxID=2950534 RepID=A0ABU2FAG2_9EURY|nr:universal stress protein [Haloarcula sp. S1CR25-12]MDS0259234.1 universal stress protein [Haloarcula sp. S1CR25-12]